MTNLDLWNYVVAHNPAFASVISDTSKKIFEEQGFEAIKASAGAKDDFWRATLQTMTDEIMASGAKDLLEDQGFGITKAMPYGGYIRDLIVGDLDPVNPAWVDREEYKAVDQQVVRKAKVSEQYFQKNLNYQNLYTLPFTETYRGIFNSDRFGELASAVAKGFAAGWTKAKYLTKKEALNAAITSKAYPLRPAQQVSTKLTVQSLEGVSTMDKAVEHSYEIIALIYAINSALNGMRYSVQTGIYNAYGFADAVDPDDMVVLMRPQIKTYMDTVLALTKSDASIDAKIIQVDDFGGTYASLTPDADFNGGEIRYDTAEAPTYDTYKVATANDGDITVTKVGSPVPIYSPLGEYVGTAYTYSDTLDGSERHTGVTVYIPKAVEQHTDPHADVLAVIADRRLLREYVTNPYTIRTAVPNVRGLYVNTYADSVDNAIVVDPTKNMVVVRNSAAKTSAKVSAKG